MNNLTEYEHEQLEAIREWLAESPSFSTRAAGAATGPISKLVQKIVPTLALKMALDAMHTAAVSLRDRRSILKRAGVADLAGLRSGELQTCDRVADGVSRRALALAGSSGAVFGVVGTIGLVVDVPSLLIQTLRTIHRIGLSYGEDCSATLARRLPIAIFALASANNAEERQAALRSVEHESLRHAVKWRSGVEGAAQRALAKDAATFSLNNLTKSLATHLGWRKAAGAVPVTGAFISGSVNAWYLHDVSRTARHVFQMRWLRQKYGEVPGLPALSAE